MLIFAILAMSLDILLGYTGLPSLGHAGIFGVAAYAVAVLSTSVSRRDSGRAWRAALLVGDAGQRGFGLLVSHVRHVYFLMITLALGMVLWGVSYRWIPVTGGDNGISGIPRLEAHARTSDRRADAVLLRRAARVRVCGGADGAARALAVRLHAEGHPRERIAHEEPGLQHLAALLPELRASPACSPASRASCGRTTTASSARRIWISRRRRSCS